nr:peroxisomal membrane 22 kDa (Mpv17/PMP22) family protein [Tanacetum cinerariifolium]
MKYIVYSSSPPFIEMRGRYAPEHNWIAYEEALKENPVFAKMVISGIVYSLGDWIAQILKHKEMSQSRSNQRNSSGF